jgi:dimethylglycine dehydrogenase
VVVIGGGVVGSSVLYHLAREGWTDAVLLERRELTSGSTWHAAGGMHTINGDPNVANLQQYTINLYKEIEDLSGQATGVHLTGGVMLAATEARLDWMKGIVAKNRYLGSALARPARSRRWNTPRWCGWCCWTWRSGRCCPMA